MKNMVNSIIIIILTIITACVMTGIKNYNNKIYAGNDEVLAIKSKIKSKNKLADKKDYANNKAEKYENTSRKDININVKADEDTACKNDMEEKKAQSAKNDSARATKAENKNGAVNTKNTVKPSNISDKSNAVVKDNNIKPEGNNKNTVQSTDEDKKEIPVFKVAKCEVINKLSLKDKATLMYISRNLSKRDYETIQQELNSDDAKKGVSNAIKLLKEKLSQKDFDEIKEIASKVINLETLSF